MWQGAVCGPVVERDLARGLVVRARAEVEEELAVGRAAREQHLYICI